MFTGPEAQAYGAKIGVAPTRLYQALGYAAYLSIRRA